jgi:hypothetical protein
LLGHQQQQVAGPFLGELVAAERFNASARIGNDDAFACYFVQHHEVAEPFVRVNMGNGGQRRGGECCVIPFYRTGRKAELFGGLHKSQQVGANAVGAGQLSHLLQTQRPTVVQADSGQRGGSAVTLIGLADTSVSAEHVKPRCEKP